MLTVTYHATLYFSWMLGLCFCVLISMFPLVFEMIQDENFIKYLLIIPFIYMLVPTQSGS